LGLKVENGKQEIVLEAPQLISGQDSKWGYVAIDNDQIFGSGKKPTASFTVLGRFNCDQFEEDFREMVMSDYLFSLDRINGKRLWSYKGVVFNNTICVGDDYIYFVESRNKKAINDPDGRLRVDDFCAGPTFLVKLNKRNGGKEWEKIVQFPYQHIMYLAYSKGVLLITGSYIRGTMHIIPCLPLAVAQEKISGVIVTGRATASGITGLINQRLTVPMVSSGSTL